MKKTRINYSCHEIFIDFSRDDVEKLQVQVGLRERPKSVPKPGLWWKQLHCVGAEHNIYVLYVCVIYIYIYIYVCVCTKYL